MYSSLLKSGKDISGFSLYLDGCYTQTNGTVHIMLTKAVEDKQEASNSGTQQLQCNDTCMVYTQNAILLPSWP